MTRKSCNNHSQLLTTAMRFCMPFFDYLLSCEGVDFFTEGTLVGAAVEVDFNYSWTELADHLGADNFLGDTGSYFNEFFIIKNFVCVIHFISPPHSPNKLLVIVSTYTEFNSE